MSEKPIIPAAAEPDTYQVVVARRVSYDNMMWQAPFLSLTAQAFLLTIALSSDTLPIGRLFSSALGVFASFASIQLMLKHRCHELADSIWLEEYEKVHSKCRPVHSKERAYAKMTWVTRWRSHIVWIAVLAAFGLAALLTFIITLVQPDVLGPARSAVS